MNKYILSWRTLSIFLFILLFTVNTQASKNKYMVIYHGYHGYNFDCVENHPYDDVSQMDWNPVDGFTEDVYGNSNFLKSVIEVENCNIDNIYESQNRLYRLGFSDIECDNNFCAIHVTGGAYWIEETGE